jgi:uncharacterized protein YecT (DUF1311 family)
MRISTMRKTVLLIAIFALVCSIGVTTVGNAAETKPTDHCTFCDTWRPYSSDGTNFASNDVFVITRDSLALPGCSPVKARVVRQGFDKDYLDDRIRPLPIYVLYELEEDPKCKRPMPLVHARTLVVVYVEQPQFAVGSERMEARIVETTKHEYGPRMIPAKIEWELIRRDYNPGDEGSGQGARIVSTIKHREVDEKLNEEWKRLLKVVEGKNRSELRRQQSLWLGAVRQRCDCKRGALPEWEVAYLTMCLNGAFKKRIAEFRNLRNCILEKRTSCPDLAADDPNVTREDEGCCPCPEDTLDDPGAEEDRQ